MFKRPTHCVLFLLIAFLTPTFVTAQPAANYRMPGAFSLDGFVRRTLQPQFGRGIYNKLSSEGFYPIGWSRDGKFAYYIEPVDEACGCYFAELVIQDMRTDKVLWHFKNDWEKHVDAEGAPIEDDIRKLWTRNQTLFSDKLREHGIIPAARFALLGRAFTLGGKTYTAKVNAPKGIDDDGNERVKSIKLEFSTPSLGRKELYSIEYKGDAIWVSPLGVAVAGAFKNPYENRVAVLMLKVQRGWEGPPHSVDVQLAGADLRSGFRK